LRIDLQAGEHPVDERLDGDLKVAPVVEPVVGVLPARTDRPSDNEEKVEMILQTHAGTQEKATKPNR
jgi:hypothetical protein